MSSPRNKRLLREALGEQEGDMPAAEGVLATAGIVLGLMVFVLFVG